MYLNKDFELLNSLGTVKCMGTFKVVPKSHFMSMELRVEYSSVDQKISPQAHVLNTWSPVCCVKSEVTLGEGPSWWKWVTSGGSLKAVLFPVYGLLSMFFGL